MAWDPTQPTTSTPLRLVPSVITPNWVAIEDGEVPLDKIQLAQQASNPSLVAATALLYSKSASGNTELFAMNSAGNATQLTKGAVVQHTETSPTKSSTGRVYLPGGVLIQWGSGSLSGTSTSLSFGTAFTTIYQVTGSITGADRSPGISSQSNSGFTVISDGSMSGMTFRWIAIGAA